MDHKCSLQETTYEGFKALELTNGRVRLVLVPELGGKFTSIQDLGTGREWLWTNPHLPARAVRYDASFVEAYDTGGVDECFPAVSAGSYPAAPWAGVQIPDHGELWCQPWQAEVVEDSDSKIILDMSCRGARFPYRFARRLALSAEDPGIILEYALENLSNFDFPFIWCIHPILKIEPGMQVRLPAGVETVQIDGGIGSFMSQSRQRAPWPLAEFERGDAPDTLRLPDRQFAQAVKLYTLPMEGREMVETAVLDPSGEHAFAFRFKPDEVSHVGVWMNLGAWSGAGSVPYYNLGLEPAIGGTDGLPDAIAMDQYAVLPAAGERRWQLELIVT